MNFQAEFVAFARSAMPGGRLRIAPTPSGFLHPGNALNFTLNWLTARLSPEGRILLRIDDLDADRKREEYVQDVFDTLQWLGLDWDEGPRTVADLENTWSQHLRLDQYKTLLDALTANNLLFACRKSRRDLEPWQGAYPPEFRRQGLSLDEPDAAWRIATPDGFPMSDFIVRRRDGLPAYQIASLSDDLQFGITHIIRGEDLRASTAAQLFLADCLQMSDFQRIKFLHHPLIKDVSGEKLSKSAGATSLRAMRESGAGPDMVFDQVAGMLGLPAGKYPDSQALLRAVRVLVAGLN